MRGMPLATPLACGNAIVAVIYLLSLFIAVDMPQGVAVAQAASPLSSAAKAAPAQSSSSSTPLTAEAAVAASTSSLSDATLFIRHGRSRSRHSNVKEQQHQHQHQQKQKQHQQQQQQWLWSSSKHSHGHNASNSSSGGGVDVDGSLLTGRHHAISLSRFSSMIPSGNGHLFGSDYWRNSDANGSIIYHAAAITKAPKMHAAATTTTDTIQASGKKATSIATAVPTLAAVPMAMGSTAAATVESSSLLGGTLAMEQGTTTLTPVTHKIRKLHKKKIMESIRNSVDKEYGVRLWKTHRSLAEAEQLQGRPTDVAMLEDGNAADGSDLDEVLQLAEELDDADAPHLDDGLLPSHAAIATADNEENNPNRIDPDNESIDNDAADDDDNDEETDGGANDYAYQNDESEGVVRTTPTTTRRKFRTTTPLPAYIDGEDELSAGDEIDGIRSVEDTEADAEEGGEELEGEVFLQLPTTTAASHHTYDYYRRADATLAQLQKRLRQHQNESVAKEAPMATVDAKTTAYAPVRPVYKDLQDDDGNLPLLPNELSNDTFGYDLTLLDAPSSADKDESESNDEGVEDGASVTAASTSESTYSAEQALGPSQSASTSVGGIGLERQHTFDLQEINFDDVGLMGDGSVSDMDTALLDAHNPDGYQLSGMGGSNPAGGVVNGDESIGPLSSNSDGDLGDGDDGLSTDNFEVNPFLAGVIDAANEEEFSDWDEISRNNRRNLMRGRDVVTKFLQIVETQHSLGSNCEAGTSLNLGEGVVDRYAQDRFRVEAEVAVNRANMLTRIFKMTARAVQADVNLLHASVLSMVEFDDDIFAAGNCFDWNEHPAQAGLFCPFAYRLPPPNLGAILAKDLATEYHYLGNTSEWFFQARKNAEKVIAHNEQYVKAFHLYSNKTEDRIEDDTLAVKYEDGRWSKPYYDCGGGNIWMLTYTVPFFGYENGTYHFKGTSGIDIDLRRVDIDQCPQRHTPGMTKPLNLFAGTDKCKQRTTMCEALKGLGFRRGSYKCICRKGYYFPDTMSTQKFFNGSLLEEEYEKLMLGRNSTYNIVSEYECWPCAEGCDSCEDSSPCIAALNWPMRTSILVLACTVIGLLPPAAWFTFRYQQVKVVRAASPALLRVIALGAFFIYCTNIVMYPNPNLYTCTARIWLREIGFSLTYGALMLKTWRISVIFRVRSAKAVKITDAALLKRLGIICGVIGTCLLVRTLVSPPDVVVGRTADDLKAFLCKTDWWDYTFTSMEVLFLAWGVRLCIMVRKAPSEFNESRFISMAIYNEFLLTCFLNVSMLFLQSPANPDLLYIIFFCHTQLTVTLLLGLIFGSKVYIVLRSGKSHQESIGLGAKASGAKFNFRPQVRTFANPSSVTTSTVPIPGTTSAETKLSDQEALEEIRQLSVQLQRIQEMAPPKGVAVMTISSLLDGLKTPGGMMIVAAAATQATRAPTGSGQSTATAVVTAMRSTQQTPTQGSLPLLTQLQVPQLAASGGGAADKPKTPERVEKAINTEMICQDGAGHVICSQCLRNASGQQSLSQSQSQYAPTTPTACQQLGSPLTEGSLNFANIKLDCMCSQPQDDDVYQQAQRRRAQVRTAATNTPPPPSAGSLRRRGVSNRSRDDAGAGRTDDGVCYRICDNCKKKYQHRSKLKGSGSRGDKRNSSSGRHKSSGGGGGRLAAADVQHQRRVSVAATTAMAMAMTTEEAGSSKAHHSNDDIVFYTTSDESERSNSSSGCSFRLPTAMALGVATTTTTTTTTTTALTAMATASCSEIQQQQPVELPAPTATATSSECVIVTDVVVVVAGNDDDAANNAHSDSAADVNAATNASSDAIITGSSANNGKSAGANATNGQHAKRPDKLMLDLNDRSKYTKEVSV